MTMDTKCFKVGLQVKEVGENGEFEGYASVFGVRDSDGDVIIRGAFARSLKALKESGKRPKMLYQHMHHEMIGSIKEVYEDEVGLFFKGQLILEIQRAREAHALMKAGELTEVSIGFMIREAAQEERGSGRIIQDVELMEISPVTWAANPEARITNVKSNIRDFERFLRDSGFSRKEALAISSGGFKGLDSPSDSDGLDSDEIALAIKQLSQTLRIQ